LANAVEALAPLQEEGEFFVGFKAESMGISWDIHWGYSDIHWG